MHTICNARRKKPKKLKKGKYLDLWTNKNKSIPHDPKDKAGLKENCFAEVYKDFKVYKPKIALEDDDEAMTGMESDEPEDNSHDSETDGEENDELRIVED